MTDFGAELVLGDLITALDRFKHQMELQRASIAEVAAHQAELDAGIAQKKQELAVACADLGRAQAKHEELHKEIRKWTKQLEGA
jgi:septal ring factor EnvC (AmiA/AmiB activator)